MLERALKSPEEDDEASELDEAEEVLRVIFPAHKYAALPLDPGEEAFYQPPSGVSSESAAVLRRGFAAVWAVRRNHLDAVAAQLLRPESSSPSDGAEIRRDR
jgi:hypothetical protein